MESTNQMPKYHTRDLEDYQPLEKVPSPLEQVDNTVSKTANVAIVCMIDSVVKVTGTVSGKTYQFSGAGSVVNVDKKDVQWLLDKRQGERQCCGGTGNGNIVFALASEK